jgi:cell division inhibitor SepF
MNNFKDKLNNFFFLNEEEEIQDEEDKATLQKEAEPDLPNESMPTKAPTDAKINRTQRKQQTSGGKNVVAINQKKALQKPQITIVEPRLYSEVQEVADYILNNQSVILNFRRMDTEQAAKMIDFLMGVTYAVKGDIQRLDEEIFICTPQSVTVNGSELSEYADSLL